jgi:hypothetical protein
MHLNLHDPMIYCENHKRVLYVLDLLHVMRFKVDDPTAEIFAGGHELCVFKADIRYMVCWNAVW